MKNGYNSRILHIVYTEVFIGDVKKKKKHPHLFIYLFMVPGFHANISLDIMISLIWFSLFNGISTLVCYLMPKPSMEKDSRGIFIL